MSDAQPEAGAPLGWIREIVLNSRDPHGLAGFWSRVVGGSPTEWYDGWVTLEPPPHGQRLSFQRSDTAPDTAPDTTPDTTPDATGVHVDVLVEDLGAAHEAVLAAGASYAGERWSPRPGPDGERVPWRVYADPEGHLFCLVVR